VWNLTGCCSLQVNSLPSADQERNFLRATQGLCIVDAWFYPYPSDDVDLVPLAPKLTPSAAAVPF
jgi:hypothetical protein